RRCSRRARPRRSTPIPTLRTPSTPTTARRTGARRPRTAGEGCSNGSASTASRDASAVNDHAGRPPGAAQEELKRLIADRALGTVFQPIFGFREGRIIGYEALVRGPEGSILQSPF